VRGAEHREGEQGAQLFLDDIGVQDLPSRSSVFTNACHIFAVTSGRRRSCAVSSRRRTRHAGSDLRPSRRARRDAVMTLIVWQLWEDNYRVYGSRKIWKAARRAGTTLAATRWPG